MTPGAAVDVLGAERAERAQACAAGALVGHGLRPGDRIAFSLPSSGALLCAVLGALRIGIVPVLLNPGLLEAERDVLLADADPAVTVTDPACLATLLRGDPVPLAPCPLARPMHYTSGTSGRAKAVWSGLWTPETAAAALADEADLWRFGPDDVHLVCSPMAHSVSIRFAGGTLLAGGTCIVLPRFDAELVRRALSGDFGPVPTTTFMAPTALSRLHSEPSGLPDLSGLRLLVHAGSPCPTHLKRAVLEETGPGVLWEFYGSTEGQFTACSPGEWLERPGTVGRARAGRELRVDDAGTVWCRPPAFGRFEYWRDEAKTATAWRDGWFTAGDLGRIDGAGYLFLDGRRDDLVITGGVNVYPAEVEAVLAEVEGVAEVAVFGLPDDRWGQRVCAAVVAAHPRLADAALVDAVHHQATARLAGYKRPKQVEVVDALPRTATGKVRRGALAAQLGRG